MRGSVLQSGAVKTEITKDPRMQMLMLQQKHQQEVLLLEQQLKAEKEEEEVTEDPYGVPKEEEEGWTHEKTEEEQGYEDEEAKDEGNEQEYVASEEEEMAGIAGTESAEELQALEASVAFPKKVTAAAARSRNRVLAVATQFPHIHMSANQQHCFSKIILVAHKHTDKQVCC